MSAFRLLYKIEKKAGGNFNKLLQCAPKGVNIKTGRIFRPPRGFLIEIHKLRSCR